MPPLVDPRSNPTSSRRDRLLDAAVWLYGTMLVAVMFVRYGLGDRTSWSFAANSLLLYAFLPAPIIAFVVAFRRTRAGVAIVGLSMLLFAWHWGALFVPSSRKPDTNEKPLRVMTYNALGYNPDTSGTNRVVREMDADIVALQELAPEHADALEKAFSATYPHRIMDPRRGVSGSGILSRYPMRKIDAKPLDRLPWIGTPIVVELEIGNHRVTFVNFHAYAGPMYTRMREEQARALVEFAQAHPGPLIFAGDLNATDQNEAHTVITRTLRDSWREAGFGFGHTFPGKPTPDIGGSRPVFLGIPVPMWLVRIDHIFHSDSFITLDAELGPNDAGSDHRAVVATLVFGRAASAH